MEGEGEIWIGMLGEKGISGKGGDVGMGKGKGCGEGLVGGVSGGGILMEVEGVCLDVGKEGVGVGGEKVGVRSKFIVRGD